MISREQATTYLLALSTFRYIMQTCHVQHLLMLLLILKKNNRMIMYHILSTCLAILPSVLNTLVTDISQMGQEPKVVGVQGISKMKEETLRIKNFTKLVVRTEFKFCRFINK